MQKIHIKILILFLLLTLMLGCKQKEETPAAPTGATVIPSAVQLTEAQFGNANLQVSLPEKVKIGHVIALNGKIETMPENTITVSSPMAGFIKQLKLIPGMMVSKGQVLVRLEDKEIIQLQQDYLSAKNVLAYAKLDLERQTELAKNQAASDKVWQLAEEKVRQSQILVKSLAEKLRLIRINPMTLTSENMTTQMVITAPASGTITEVSVNSGKYVQAGDDLLKMIGFDGIRLVLKAFEKDLPFLKKGQKLTAYSNTQPEKNNIGKIEYIVQNIGQEGYTDIICTLENVSDKFIPGTYLNANIEAQSQEGWTVPEEAVLHFEGKEYVFTEKEKRTYDMVEVKTGQNEKGNIQILNHQDIKERKVVVKGAYTLLMKMKNVGE
ncbi:MAG: efflux RND transporter periplasmic adaptor subunit [Saprospiraceae bacterium]|nr:efflux RND transporter periplasmic adaptor subunit [Saprospiraceae bacterium]